MHFPRDAEEEVLICNNARQSECVCAVGPPTPNGSETSKADHPLSGRPQTGVVLRSVSNENSREYSRVRLSAVVETVLQVVSLEKGGKL